MDLRRKKQRGRKKQREVRIKEEAERNGYMKVQERCMDMEQLLAVYYQDNAKKLHRLVDKILLKFVGLSDKDLDDFYSLAN